MYNPIERAADVTVATIPVNDYDASAFGIVKVNKKGYTNSFIEKPDASLLPGRGNRMSLKKTGAHFLASKGIERQNWIEAILFY